MKQTETEARKKLKDIPVANESLYKETAGRCKTSPKQVEECVKIVGTFIADTVKKGAFETVMIPFFGKFRVKVKRLQNANDRNVITRMPKIEPKIPLHIIDLATGTLTPKDTTDEVIHTQ